MKLLADEELLMRLFAEAVKQLGGTMTVCVADLDEHREHVDVSIDGDVLVSRSDLGDSATPSSRKSRNGSGGKS